MRLLFFLFAILSFGCTSQNTTSNATNSMIEAILQFDDPAEAIMALNDSLNKKCNYGEKIDLLSGPEKVVLFIENLEREINNGGFNQFYLNSSGNFAHETHDALVEIGALRTAKIVNTANNEWPNGKVIVDWEDRQDLLFKIESKSNPIWTQCDEAFYEYKDNIASLLFEYVRKNKNAFD